MVARLLVPALLLCDPECTVVRDAAVDITAEGRNGYCGPAASAPETPANVTRLSGILLPGLINAHAHSPMTVLRGMGGDLPLLRWLREVIFPAEAKMTPSDVHAGMVLGSLEMLRHGVTTSAEMYYHGEQIADAVLSTGGRTVLGVSIIDLPGLDWRPQVDAVDKWIDADGLRFGAGDRIELSYGAHSAYLLPQEALRQVTEAAK
ncbi:MAG: amidohydrolase family protein, partial [Thermocrispum sp.]